MSASSSLLCGAYRLSLDRPLVMGIVNLTMDSFSGDGLGASQDFVSAALQQAQAMVTDGADLLDIGAESTRPGAAPVSEADELARVLPVLRALRSLDVPLSVDTSKPAVMAAAIAAGADMINDVNGFRAPGAIEAVAQSTVGLCVMHMQGEPRTMQQAPHYQDVVQDVYAFLAERLTALTQAGIAPERISLDPGFCFGKTVEHNYQLLAQLPRLLALQCPLLVGMSRKSMLGAVTGKPVTERLAASVAAHVLACEWGARLLRVHDVKEIADAVKVWVAAQCAR